MGSSFLGGLAGGLGVGLALKEERKTQKAIRNIANRPVSPPDTKTDLSEAVRNIPGNEDLPTKEARYSLRRGGRITRDGVFKLHAGEVVLPKRIVKRLVGRKSVRKASRKTSRR